jgi:hypothetical protein
MEDVEAAVGTGDMRDDPALAVIFEVNDRGLVAFLPRCSPSSINGCGPNSASSARCNFL